ncbi:MAG TPA: prohibitin family protein [Candidatus Bathyarchaeia archaeon]|nr:prohibitin family protein [Candidatus Bathyarchaeia archaeon]
MTLRGSRKDDDVTINVQSGRRRFPRTLKWLLVLGIIAIIAVPILANAVVIVPTGNKGVVMTWGQATTSLGDGLHFVVPVAQQVILMDTTIQKYEDQVTAASQDLQDVSTTIVVNYRIDPDFVLDIYRNFRQEYAGRVIQPNIEETLKATTANYKAEELITKRSEVKMNFDSLLVDRLGPFHIVITSVSITNFQFSEEFTRAIEAKVTAEQKALEAKNKLEQIKYEAQQQVIQAEAYYNATITRARADAEAIRLLQINLNPEYLQYQSILKWDGKLPYFLGSGAIPFIQIPTNSTSP